MTDLINVSACAEALASLVSNRLGIETDPDALDGIENTIRGIIAVHVAIAPKDYLSQLRAALDAVEMLFNSTVQASADVAGVMDELLNPEAARSALQ